MRPGLNKLKAFTVRLWHRLRHLSWRTATPILFVLIFAIAGVGYLVFSHAATAVDYEAAYQGSNGDLWVTGNAGNYDTGLGMASGTSPSIFSFPNGTWEAAFQANTGALWVTGTNSGTIDIGNGMAAHTSPSIVSLPNGTWEVAFQANTGALWVAGTNSGTIDIGNGMAPGTSPSITPFPNGTWEVAFQANTGALWVAGTDSGTIDIGNGMAAGTSPSINSNPNGTWEVAFQANTGALWVAGTTSGTIDIGNGMAPGTSPSITSGPNGTWEVAFQANTGALWVAGTDSGTIDIGNGMAAGTSPSITPFSDGTWEVAFQANTGALWVAGTNNGTIDFGNGMAPGTSPSIVSGTVTTTPAPTASLTGPGSVPAGTGPTLTIATTNASNCNINGSAVGTSGSITEPLIVVDTTYTLSCNGPGGPASAATTVLATRIGETSFSQDLPPPPGTPAQIASGNKLPNTWVNFWAGYQDVQHQYNAISTDVVVPTVTCGTATENPAGEHIVFWVGIGDGSSVQQTGVGADCQADYNVGTGTMVYFPTYYTWWTICLSVTNQKECMQRSMNVTVKPGDTVHEAVQFTNNQYVFTITNKTTGQTYTSPPESCKLTTCTRNYAEWIVERPAVNGKLSTLANFSPATFTNTSVTPDGDTARPYTGYKYQAIEMYNPNNSTYLAKTKNSTSSGFTVTYGSN